MISFYLIIIKLCISLYIHFFGIVLPIVIYVKNILKKTFNIKMKHWNKLKSECIIVID